MSDINVFLEVRDSRIPFSSKNPEFDEIVKKYNKKKVIIMNKFDLCNQHVTQKIISDYQQLGINCFSMSATTGGTLKKVHHIEFNLFPAVSGGKSNCRPKILNHRQLIDDLRHAKRRKIHDNKLNSLNRSQALKQKRRRQNDPPSLHNEKHEWLQIIYNAQELKLAMTQ